MIVDLARAVAARTRLRHLEKPPGSDHLTPSAACRACLQAGSRRGTGTAAGRAMPGATDLDFFLHAARGFFESDFQVVAQIRPAPLFGA